MSGRYAPASGHGHGIWRGVRCMPRHAGHVLLILMWPPMRLQQHSTMSQHRPWTPGIRSLINEHTQRAIAFSIRRKAGRSEDRMLLNTIMPHCRNPSLRGI